MHNRCFRLALAARAGVRLDGGAFAAFADQFGLVEACAAGGAISSGGQVGRGKAGSGGEVCSWRQLEGVGVIGFLVPRVHIHRDVRFEALAGQSGAISQLDGRGGDAQTLAVFERELLRNQRLARRFAPQDQAGSGVAQHRGQGLRGGRRLAVDKNGHR